MKQVLCYFMDGTSRHLVHFDRLKEDAGYAGAIESAPERLVSSHAVKRFFNAFYVMRRMRLIITSWRWRSSCSNASKRMFARGGLPVTAYATTVRRKLIDIAAKIVKKSGKIILRVTAATWKALQFDVLWQRSGSPHRFVWA